MPHPRPWQPLQLITNGDSRAVAGGIVMMLQGAYLLAGGPLEGQIIFTGGLVVLIVIIGTWLGGKDGPDLSAAVEQGRQQGLREGAARVRAKIGQPGAVYLDALADEVEGGG
jgi:hypothetical protein